MLVKVMTLILTWKGKTFACFSVSIVYIFVTQSRNSILLF